MARRLPGSIDDVTRVVTSVWTHPANRGRRGRKLASVLAFRSRAALGKSTVVPLGERSSLLATLDHANSIVAAYGNPPDFWEWHAWSRLLHPGDLFVDVGANVGIYTILAAELGCRVLAFEPDPANLAALRENVALNDIGDQVTIIPKAVSDHVGSIGFHGGRDALARVARSDEKASLSIDCTTLDAEINERIHGLKVDVEGSEGDVLRGCRRLLESGAIDCIQLEWNDMAEANFGTSRSDLRLLLDDVGYRMDPTLGLDPGLSSFPESRVNAFFVAPEEEG